MLKGAVFGSCMSNLTMKHLITTYKVIQTHSIHHNRSDSFLKYYIDQSHDMISLSDLDYQFKLKDENDLQARYMLNNQYAENMGFHEMEESRDLYGTFLDYIGNGRWDIILLDNFMDVAAKLVYDRFRDSSAQRPLFLNSQFYENEAEIADRFHHTDFLTPQQSAENWHRIYQWIRQLQPSAKIFFIPYHACSSTENSERFTRISEFYPLFSRLTAGEDIHIVPPINVRAELTKGQIDWPHFDERIYHALAGYIYLTAEGGFSATPSIGG